MGIIIRQAHVAAEVIAGTLQGNKELAWVGLTEDTDLPPGKK